MNKLIKTFIYFSLAFMILQLTEANAKILFAIKQLEIHPVFDIALAIFKALGFSVATTTVIIKYKQWYVKSGFVLLDAAVLFIYYHFDKEIWWQYSSYVYPVYTGIIFLSFGFLAHEFIQSSADSIELKSIKLKEKIVNLKRTGSRKTKWQDDPKRKAEIYKLEKEFETLRCGVAK